MKTIKSIFPYFLIILIVNIFVTFAEENNKQFLEEKKEYIKPIYFPDEVDSIIFNVRNWDCITAGSIDSVYLRLDKKFYKRFLEGIKLINAKAWIGSGCKLKGSYAYMDFYIPLSIQGDKIRIKFIYDFTALIEIGGKECNIVFNKKFSDYLEKLYWKARNEQNKK